MTLSPADSLEAFAAGAASAAAAIIALSAGYLPVPGAGAGPRGTPQGSPLSPLLATSVLDPLDQALDRSDRVLVRYVDDILLVCRDERAARRGLEEVRWQLGLALSEPKTLLQPYDAGFTFLGAQLPQPAWAGAGGALAGHALADAFRSTGYWRARSLMRVRKAASPNVGQGDRA